MRDGDPVWKPNGLCRDLMGLGIAEMGENFSVGTPSMTSGIAACVALVSCHSYCPSQINLMLQTDSDL